MILNLSTNHSSWGPSFSSAPKKTADEKILNNGILSYEIDKDGYFTSQFNDEIGIPRDYKIHSKSIENFVSYQNSTSFSKFDLKKTIQNAYKLFSQIIDETKQNFNKEDLNSIPQAFEFDKNLNITKTYSFTDEEYKDFLHIDYADYTPKNNQIKITTFFSFDDKILSENLFSYTPYDINKNAYINSDGTISKAGIFLAFLSGQKINNYIAEGNTNLFGKLQGFDKNMSEIQVNEFWDFVNEYSEYFDPSELFFGVLKQDLSIEEFKKLALSKKEQVLKQKQSNSNFKELQENQETKKPFKPIQVESKSKTYKDTDRLNALELAKDRQLANMLEILFGFKSNSTLNNTDKNNLLSLFSKMNLNPTSFKGLDIKV